MKCLKKGSVMILSSNEFIGGDGKSLKWENHISSGDDEVEIERTRPGLERCTGGDNQQALRRTGQRGTGRSAKEKSLENPHK